MGCKILDLDFKCSKCWTPAQYDIPQAAVFSNKNPSQKGKTVYYPIYMLMFQKKQSELAEMIYRPDFSALMWCSHKISFLGGGFLHKAIV